MLIAAAVFASCQKTIDNPVLEPMVQKTFLAIMEEDTKTSRTDDGSVYWSEGDVIRYYSSKNGSIGTFEVPSSGRRTEMTVSIRTGDTFLTAVYGGGAITENTGKSFILQDAIKGDQSGLFADAHVAVSKTYDMSDNASLAFKNITSLFKFSISRDDISYIVFSGNSGEQLHGNGTLAISFSGETSSAAYVGETGTSITIRNIRPGAFYISTLPVLLENGFAIKCYDVNDRLIGICSYDKPVDLKQNEIINMGSLDSHIKRSYTDLSESGPANCYIISGHGDYMFDATIKGCGPEKIGGTPYIASVLWECDGSGNASNAGSIVNNVSFRDGFIYFSTGGKDGNALIAVKDRDDEILWTWHLWICKDYNPSESSLNYPNGVGIIMDRNLGATISVPGDSNATGMFYKWGMKDPLPEGNGEESIIHTPSWNEGKGYYNPCPAGWHIPEGGPSGFWSTAFASSFDMAFPSQWNVSAKGMTLFGNWYPASGKYDTDIRAIVGSGESGAWWTYYKGADTSSAFEINAGGAVSPCKENYERFECNVRCVSDNNPSIVAPNSITIESASSIIEPDDYIQLKAHIEPSTANVTTVKWSSCDDNIATVDESGIVTGIASGFCTIKATTYNGISSEFRIIVANTSDNANCHIVAPGELISFRAVKGNSGLSVGAASYVSVLWESYGTEYVPKVGAVVAETGLSGSKLYVHAGNHEGNAVVAVYNQAGTILWSYHIWVESDDLEAVAQEYYNNAGTVLDRNLGATSATPGDVTALGLMYQWGRKDPFLGSVGYSNGRTVASTATWPSRVKADKSSINVAYAIQHPMVLILGVAKSYFWNWNDSYGLWNTKKTMYDPCPAGWRVPDGGDDNYWFKAHGSSTWIKNPYDYKVEGINFGGDFGSDESIWYPGSSYKDKESGDQYFGSLYYWTCTQYGSSQAYCLGNNYYHFPGITKEYESQACAVRCIKE